MKRYIDACLCGLFVCLLWILCFLYLEGKMLKNEEPIFGFGFLIYFTYTVIIVFFALKGLGLGLVVYIEAILFFSIFRFSFAVYNQVADSLIEFIKTQLLIPFSLVTLISGVVAGIITTIFKNRKIAVFIGLGVFYGLIILSTVVVKYS